MLAYVLLVDDNPLDNLLHRRALLSSGVVSGDDHSLTASDGRDAFELLERGRDEGAAWFPPDLILVDLHMPRMDGVEFVEAATPLLNGESRKSTIVLMVTSTQDAQDRARIDTSTGIHEYVPKPLRKEQAIELVRRHAAAVGSAG